MELGAILEAITTVGFPIAMCIIMMYYIKYVTDNNKAEIEKITNEHRAEMVEITKAVENNTVALTQLSERLARGEE